MRSLHLFSRHLLFRYKPFHGPLVYMNRLMLSLELITLPASGRDEPDIATNWHPGTILDVIAHRKTHCCRARSCSMQPACYAGTPSGDMSAWRKRGGNGGGRNSPNQTATEKGRFKLRDMAPWVLLFPSIEAKGNCGTLKRRAG